MGKDEDVGVRGLTRTNCPDCGGKPLTDGGEVFNPSAASAGSFWRADNLANSS
nr:hypothetical protein [Lacticaseibacillus sharpeae]